MPVAVPLHPTGAILLTSDGWVASSTLNPKKKINNASRPDQADSGNNINQHSASKIKPIAIKNTLRIRRFFSAMMICGTASANAINNNGK